MRLLRTRWLMAWLALTISGFRGIGAVELSSLPVTAGPDQPVLLLDLGRNPVSPAAAPGMQVSNGMLTASPGAGGQILESDEVQILHPGFGTFGAYFRFPLDPNATPGRYRFFARYKSGGEVSEVRQTFTLKAGSDSDRLVPRGEFALTNTTPWEYQWLAGTGTLTLLPGDRYIAVENAGKADGAKVFDAFLLQLDTPLAAWMSPADAELRNRFLARIQAVERPERRLYVLDGPGPNGAALFQGLAGEKARQAYQGLRVQYLIGPDAAAMAKKLNWSIPSLLLSDGNFSLLGALAAGRDARKVADFLADPARFGTLPPVPALAGESSQPLRDGFPEAWLVGGLYDGPAGLALQGLDSESVLRPNPEQPYFSVEMMGGRMRLWHRAATDLDGQAVIEAATEHDYRWSKGTGYGQIYLHAEQATEARLRLHHTGIAAAAWLDGAPLALAGDTALPALTPGWHSLLVKIIMQQDRGQRFAFTARFTDGQGKPLVSLLTQTSDPAVDAALNQVAGKLRPLVYVEAPANLPHPGDPLKVRADLRWHPLMEEPALASPLPGFRARLRVTLKDYRGREIAAEETEGIFPGTATLDFGAAPEAGYYAVHLALLTPAGKTIIAYPADGFTVVRGNAAQRHRIEQKKLWNNDYYAFADGDKSFQQEDGYFTWLERMGLFRSYGSYPGFEAGYRALWESAQKRGLEIFADSAGDSHWLNDTPEAGSAFVASASPYTRYFKSSNEIDIRREGEWQNLRDPAHWVERARWEFQRIHAARPDGHYVGGSLVKPGDRDDNGGYPGGLGPGRWFQDVLERGLDRYLDAWDVHAYPQQVPRFGGPIGNAETEDERGVLATYARLGRNNSLPFWLGEAGAKAAHGATGRRWQAEQVAKMVAWVNSRTDYLGLAFCIAHEYDLGYGRLWDYSLGHKPGEAALYTASALIDGLPYRAVATGDAAVQAAYFGQTLMLWRADGGPGEWGMQLDPREPWVLVDVVGQAEDLPVPGDGRVRIPLSESPVYLLGKAEYRRLVGE